MIRVAPAVLSVVLLAVTPLHATTVEKLSDARQASVSTAVVIATVGDVAAGVHPKWERPLTLTTIHVEEVLHGAAPKTLVVQQLRGELDGVYSMIPGDAELRTGERCVLFLLREDGTWFLTALGQSKYRVVQTDDGPVLERDLELSMVERGPDGRLHPTEPNDEGQTLGTFRKTMASLDADIPTPKQVPGNR